MGNANRPLAVVNVIRPYPNLKQFMAQYFHNIRGVIDPFQEN
jgi:hypothetical protein